MAGDVAVAGERREDVAARSRSRRYAGACCACLRNSSARLRSGRAAPTRSSSSKKPGWTGSGSTASLQAGRDREPRGRRRLDRDAAPAAAGQDRQDRRRDAGAGAVWPIKRGEPRVCAMVVAPSPEEEDGRRRLSRERQMLDRGAGCARQSDQGASVRARHRATTSPCAATDGRGWRSLRTGDGRALPEHLKAQISRELDRLELLLEQIKAVEAERTPCWRRSQARGPRGQRRTAVAMMLALKGIGAELPPASGRRACSGTSTIVARSAPMRGLRRRPGKAARSSASKGISKAGNPRLRTLMIQLAWLWLRHQPQSALSALVPRARPARAQKMAQERHRRPGAQAPRRLVEVRDARRRHRGRRDEVHRQQAPRQDERRRGDGRLMRSSSITTQPAMRARAPQRARAPKP